MEKLMSSIRTDCDPKKCKTCGKTQ